jgi:galactokinase/mevalonate kinase-like predicted kinase
MFDKITRYDGTNASDLIDIEKWQKTYEENCDSYLKENRDIVHLIEHNIPVSHTLVKTTDTTELKQILLDYARKKEQEGIDGDNSLIKAERAYFILSDVTNDLSYRNKIDELENNDFMTCMNRILSREKQNSQLAWSIGQDEALHATAPMKVALSSANGSDRHGAAKLEGSRVLNMAINLVMNNEAAPTIKAHIHLLDEQKLVFEGYNDMTGTFQTHHFEMDKTSIDLFFNGNVTNVEKDAFSNSDDFFRFYKYGLVFSGIINCFGTSGDVRSLLWNSLMTFTGNKGLLIHVSNTGPSRSGFSSSSAIMVTILSLLYRVSNQHDKLSRVYDLALLAENCLGLRSGWNDTYTLLPGIHDFFTLPTRHLPTPQINPIPFETEQLEKRLFLIHTGLQRKATGRMNRRHEIYLSKDPSKYPYLMKSLIVHEHIVHALHVNDFVRLGELMTQYMDFRIAFDPEATNEYLERFFTILKEKKLIYGGLLAGAMGGGIAQVIASDLGLELENGVTKLERQVNELKVLDFCGYQPFNNALYRKIDFGINQQGVTLDVRKI